MAMLILSNRLNTVLALSLACAATPVVAVVSIQNFEAGLPASWTTTGTAWTVGGATGTSPNILPPEGLLFARSGAPNGPGSLGEALVGTLTSPALTVTYTTLEWMADGWSGQFGNGLSRFEILDAGFAVKATVAPPLSDTWALLGVNLLGIGLSAGSAFYFRAIDGNNNALGNGYSWMALDDLRFNGTAVAVPEPQAAMLILAGLVALGLRQAHRARPG